ncbi:MAG: M28 family peptidase [Planctomycetes bacterium]|nr:M28 family peptidase [Planctomycetota bacterium]
MLKPNKSTLFVLIFLLVLTYVRAQEQKSSEDMALYEITVDDATKHLKFLASKELKGREAGTDEGKKAAEYIAENLKDYGILPAGDNKTYYQIVPGLGKPSFDVKNNHFKIWTAGKDADEPITEECELGKEYSPMGYVSSTEINAQIVFAGFGITAPELNYDDYDSINVKNKIAIVFRYVPKYGQKDTQFQGASYNHAYFHAKLANARKHGAKAILMLNPPGMDSGVMSPGRSGFSRSGNIPLIQITEEIGNKLLEGTGKTVKSVYEAINKNSKPQSFEIKFRKIHVKIKNTRSAGQNVLGMIEGSDEKLKDEIIIVGAHFDHIGMGYFGSRVGAEGKGKIHFGADDNASGTVGVMAIAKAFAKLKPMTKRTLVFALWDGEEKGLVGSSYFVEHPTIKLKNVVAYINFDMIGRLRNEKLNAIGTGTSEKWEEIINGINEEFKFKIGFSKNAFGGSDHASFARYKIPVIFFITDGHPDYHTPRDTVDKINYEGIVKVSKFTFKLMLKLAQSDERPLKWGM